MCLVHNDSRIHLKLVIIQALSEQDTISHILYNGLVRSAVLETDGIPHDTSQLTRHLFRHSLGH